MGQLLDLIEVGNDPNGDKLVWVHLGHQVGVVGEVLPGEVVFQLVHQHGLKLFHRQPGPSTALFSLWWGGWLLGLLLLRRLLLRVLLLGLTRLFKLLLRSRVDHLDLLRSQLGHLAQADRLHWLGLHRLHLLDGRLGEGGGGGVVRWLHAPRGATTSEHRHRAGIIVMVWQHVA